MKQRTTHQAIAHRAKVHSRVLAELEYAGGLTAVELAEVMNVSRGSVDRYLGQLYAEQKIHVGAWHQADKGVTKGHLPSRVWRVGPGRTAVRPKPEDPRIARARYREKMRLVISAKKVDPNSSRHNLANNPFWQLMA